MSEQRTEETVFTGDDGNITAKIDRTSDPGRPLVCIEYICNELWLDADEARAVAAYLQRILPVLERGGEDG